MDIEFSQNNFHPKFKKAPRYAQYNLNLQLISAIKTNHESAIYSLVEIGAELWCKTKTTHFTPLMIAARLNKLIALSILLDLCDLYDNKNVYRRNAEGETALMVAAREGHLDIVKELLFRHPESIHETDNEGNTALIHAAKWGHLETVLALLSDTIPIAYRARVQHRNNQNKTALMLAAQYGFTKVVYELTKIDPEGINAVDFKNTTALMFAAYFGHLDVMRTLLSFPNPLYRANLWLIDNEGRTALMDAARNNKGHVLNEILEGDRTGIDVADDKGMTALMHAAAWGHVNAVQLLLDSDADVSLIDRDNHSALWHAIHFGHTGVFNLLRFRTKKEIKAEILFDAAENGYSLMVSFILDHNLVNINAVNDLGLTALMLAAQKNQDFVIKRLIGRADIVVNQTSPEGMTALMFAIQEGHLLAVKALLVVRKGSAVNVDLPTPKMGMTPLMLAADLNEVGIARELLNKQAKINTRDKNGCTALMYAAKNGHAAMVELLLQYKPKINSPNHKGHTALFFAEKYHRKEVQKRLSDYCLKNGLAFMRVAPSYLPHHDNKRPKCAVESKVCEGMQNLNLSQTTHKAKKKKNNHRFGK